MFFQQILNEHSAVNFLKADAYFVFETFVFRTSGF